MRRLRRRTTSARSVRALFAVALAALIVRAVRARKAAAGCLPSPLARRFPQGLCVRATATPAGEFALISGHEERQLRLALAVQEVEVALDPGAPAGELPADSRAAHGDDALARGLFVA